MNHAATGRSITNDKRPVSKMTFIHDNFLLKTAMARRLYHEVAKEQPIIDYHCHLPPADIAANRRFNNLFEAWLEGDHYKWRAMRAHGIDERYCTGDAEPYDKFLAWARTVPATLRNPLYHWTHLELKRYFGIEELLNEGSAPAIWDAANACLADPSRSVHGILQEYRVRVVGTTDDPADDLVHHRSLAESDLSTLVVPSFRPDKLMKLDDLESWNSYVNRFGAAAETDVSSYSDLVEAFGRRHDAFHALGCRLSDHGLSTVYARFESEAKAAEIFARARKGESVSGEDQEVFATAIMLLAGRLNAEKGWVMQLHLGALRNTNSRMFKQLGPDTGFDAIGDWLHAGPLTRFLDRLDCDHRLPKVILYNTNPKDNYIFASMAGNFQDGSVPGKVQFGSGWWFLDQRDGMRWQINALSNIGLLRHFVGMLTDSRSFLSFPRHEYFRRLFCDILGDDVVAGEIPDDFDLLADLVRGVSYENAARYFGFSLPSKTAC